MVRITASNEAPPYPGGPYLNYIAGRVYTAETDPPATPGLVERAVREGWGEIWPPVEPPESLADAVAEALDLDGEPALGDLVIATESSAAPHLIAREDPDPIAEETFAGILGDLDADPEPQDLAEPEALSELADEAPIAEPEPTPEPEPEPPKPKKGRK